MPNSCGKDRIGLPEIILFLLLGFCVYLNSLWINFIWDDICLIIDNPLIKSFSNLPKVFTTYLSVHNDKFYRPLQNITYMLDFFLYKFDYRGYHFTNILLHIFAVTLAYAVSLMIGLKKKIAFPAALLYLICPLWVESVAYISGRADILMAIFIFLSFRGFLIENIYSSAIFFVFALLSKEASLIYPLVAFFYLVLFKKKSQKKLLSFVIYLVLIAVYAFLRLLAAGRPGFFHDGYPLSLRLMIFLEAIPKYLIAVFLPVNQHMSQAMPVPTGFFDPNFLISLLACVLLCYALVYYWAREKGAAFFTAWFFIFLLPNSGFMPINAFFAEHFVYLAAFGIFIFFIYFLRKAQNKIIFWAIFSIYLIFFSVATIRYNAVWQDPVRLYRRIISFSPGSFDIYNNLGVAYLERQEYELSEQALTRALQLNPELVAAKLNLARLYYLRQDFPKAIATAQEALKSDPGSYLAANYLGIFYLKSGQPSQAEAYLKKAIKLNANFVPLRVDLYWFYKNENKGAQAQKILKEIKEIDEYSLAQVYFKEAQELFNMGQPQKAGLSIKQALKINPKDSDFFALEGAIFKSLGDYPQALQSFKKAQAINPGNWALYNNIGNILALQGRFSAAQKYFRRAMALNPLSADSSFNLALSFFEEKNFKQAQIYLENALKIYPDHFLAKEYLKKIKAAD